MVLIFCNSSFLLLEPVAALLKMLKGRIEMLKDLTILLGIIGIRPMGLVFLELIIWILTLQL